MADTTNHLEDLDWESIRDNRAVRMRLAKQSFYWFSHLYFGDYIQYPTAGFQREMYHLLQDEEIRHLSVVAFRGSGKSTIVTTMYPLWAALGVLDKKYILIVSQTQNQAQQHLKNIRHEIETSQMFGKDFGNLKEETDEWGSMSVVLPKFNARISAVSTEQSIRGTRHGAHRPDLVIADDIEDIHSVKTREQRDKTFQWYSSEVIPVGDTDTKFVVVGNLLHTDSFMMRLKSAYEDKPGFAFKEYPLIDNDNSCLWPEKYPEQEDIDRLRSKVPSEHAWYREYMLKILPDNRQLVMKADISYYATIPKQRSVDNHRTAISVDLAISKSTTADLTGIVTLEKHGVEEDTAIYVHPFPVNKRNNYSETVQDIKDLKLGHRDAEVYIEDVSMQRSIIEMLDKEGIDAEAVPIKGRDKQERLQIVSYWVKNGTIKFPKKGCDELINQIVNFGVERDDLLDAFTLGVIHFMENKDSDVIVGIGRHNLWADRFGRSRQFWLD